MRKNFFERMNLIILVIFMFGLSCVGTTASAGTLTETLKKLFNSDIGDFAKAMKSKVDTFELMPIRVISVKGDAAKFRALNWMNDGTTGGIKKMTFNSDIGKGNQLSFEGHAIPGDNDLGASFKLIKGNGGYISMDYGNFRKYYDIYGGFYTNFTTAAINKMAVNPELDIGHFNFEIGSGTGDDSAISLSYQRDTKDGIKSRLAWGDVIQDSKTRKINPSWQDVGTATDAIELKGNIGVAGFNVSGKQRAEFYAGRTMREDNDTTVLVRTSQEPQAKQLVSSLRADRWIVNDKTYVAFAYQFQHLTSDMLQTIAAYSSTTGAPASDSHNGVTDGQASRDSHSWVQHFATNLTPNLNISTKLKQEIIAATGSGFREGFLGGSNRTDESENQVTRIGESFSLRYSGISKTSLYTDWDFQQTRNWNSKDRVGTSHTEYLDNNPEITGVMGVRYSPNSKFNITSNVRLKSDHNTYNTFSNNDAGVTISRIQTESDEWSNKVTWKPTKWLQNSFRLQFLNTVYRIQSSPQYVTQTDWIESNANSKIYTYDVSLQPWDEWMFNLGASMNQFKVSTPASQTAVSGGGIPVFESDFFTLLFSTSYVPKENFSVFSSVQYSRANDFDAQNFSGMPYGVNNEHYDITVGMKWSPKKDITLEPRYGYYAYRANPNDNLSLDYGNYSAHVLWLDTKFNW